MRELSTKETNEISGGHPIVAIIIYLGVRAVIRTAVKAAIVGAAAGATTAAIENATK